jgi:hypothetical protein
MVACLQFLEVFYSPISVGKIKKAWDIGGSGFNGHKTFARLLAGIGWYQESGLFAGVSVTHRPIPGHILEKSFFFGSGCGYLQ